MSTCANCGTPHEVDALFCARCGRQFTSEFKGTPLSELEHVSPILKRLRENLGERYAIERELGKGGMATVFLARDVKHDREIAIKVLDPDISASVGGERFEREIRVAAKLQHPNILGLFDSGIADGLVYYVMPFVRGDTLRGRLEKEGMLPIDDAVRIALQVASALGAAHEAGIIHRDIKPENIMLAGEHTLVADFGIARAAIEGGAEKLTQTGITVGTPVYMAPEQATGDPVGPTSDLYSLGCVLYEMLAGEPPFTGPNLMAIASKHLMEVVPSVRVVRPAVPEELEQAIYITLNKQAIDRPQNAAQFAELLGGMSTSSGAMLAMRASTAMRGSVAMRGSAMMRGSTMVPRMTTGPYGVPVLMDPPAPLWKRPVVWGAGGATLVAAALAIAFYPRAEATARDPNANRVAVTYFRDESPDSSLGPVADGLTEGLIRTLGQVSQLQVISRGGVEPYRGRDVAVDSVARALRAGYVVTGSLTPENARVRIDVRLSKNTGTSVDARSFTVARDSLTLAQGALATVVADLVRGPLGAEIELGDQRIGTRSNAAWLAVQDGMQLQRRGVALLAAKDSAADRVLVQADSALASAERLDSKWIEPRTRRAALAFQRSRMVGTNPQAIRPWVAVAIGHAERALELDKDDVDALEMRGTARYWGVINRITTDEEQRSKDLFAAQADLERVVEFDERKATAHTSLSHMYYAIPGKTNSDVYRESLAALKHDEFQANIMTVRRRLFNASFDLGQFTDADQYCVELERRVPGDQNAVRCRMLMLSIPTLERYDVARGWRLADSLVASRPDRDTVLVLSGHMYAAAILARAAGKAPTPAEARALADSARSLARRALGDATIQPARDLALYGAYVAAILGDTTDIYRRIGEFVAVDPSLRGRSFREDPTWMFNRYSTEPSWRRALGVAR